MAQKDKKPFNWLGLTKFTEKVSQTTMTLGKKYAKGKIIMYSVGGGLLVLSVWFILNLFEDIGKDHMKRELEDCRIERAVLEERLSRPQED